MEESWKNRVKDAIENGIIYPDGHQILDPKFYEGFEVDHLVFVYFYLPREYKYSLQI